MDNIISVRIKELLAERGMSWQELAEKANIPEETLRNIYYGKVKDPKASTMLAVSKIFSCSINWLMGEQFMTKDEEELLRNYRDCGNHGKAILQVNCHYEATIAKFEREAPNKRSIPCFVPQSITCEGLQYNIGNHKNIYTIEPEAFISLEVPNNHWTPQYCKGDIILFANRFPASGEIALFTWKELVYLRQYVELEKDYVLRCVNGRHEDLHFRRMDELDCVGTAIGVVRA